MLAPPVAETVGECCWSGSKAASLVADHHHHTLLAASAIVIYFITAAQYPLTNTTLFALLRPRQRKAAHRQYRSGQESSDRQKSHVTGASRSSVVDRRYLYSTRSTDVPPPATRLTYGLCSTVSPVAYHQQSRQALPVRCVFWRCTVLSPAVYPG